MTSNKTWAGICLGVGFTLLAAALSQWPSARAGVPCTLPFNLQNGTPADATQVMANYQALVTCLGQAAAAGANSDITSLTALTTPITPAQGGSVVFVGGTTTGSANAQVISGTTPTFIPTEGFIVTFTAGFTNTGQMTLQVGTTPAATVLRKTVFSLGFTVGGEIIQGQTYGVRYRASAAQFEILTMETQIPGEIRDFGGPSGAVPPGWFLADGSCKSRTTYALLFAVIGTQYDPTGSTCDVNNFALPDARGRVFIGQDTLGTRVTTAGSGCNGNVLGGVGCGAQNVALATANIPQMMTSGAGASFNSGTITVNLGGSVGTSGSSHSHTINNATNMVNNNAGGLTVGSGNPYGIKDLTSEIASGGTHTHNLTGGDATATASFNQNALSPTNTQGTVGTAPGALVPVSILQPLQVVNKIIKF